VNFDLSDEQTMLRDMLNRYLRERHDFESRQRHAHDGAELWTGLADLGILGAVLPEQAGGLGGGAVETMLIMEALGEALVTAPYLENVVIGGGLLARFPTDATTALLTRIGTGEARLAATLDGDGMRADRRDEGYHLHGTARTVIHAPGASHMLIAARDREGDRLIFLIEATTPGMVQHPYRLIDDRPAADLTIDCRLPAAALLASDDAAGAAIAATEDAARAALCAEAVGVLRHMFNDTLAYARQRQQFGQPLARFQVLQHRMVDMYIALEQAISASYLATLNLHAAPADRARAVAAAKAMIGTSARFIGEQAVQLHGAMGMTEELAVGHYFKRATAIAQQMGSRDQHVRRYAAMPRMPA
jgi:alkylation response protein AidB-like acyl-CoA dehydrogenase